MVGLIPLFAVTTIEPALLENEIGRHVVFGGNETFNNDPHWRDDTPFFEYFHADSGAGIGASHQTGWTGLAAKLIQQQGEHAHSS